MGSFKDQGAVSYYGGGGMTTPWATDIEAQPGYYFEITRLDHPELFVQSPGGPPTIDGNGALSFTPAPDQSGQANMTVVLVDASGRSDPHTLTINITAG